MKKRKQIKRRTVLLIVFISLVLLLIVISSVSKCSFTNLKIGENTNLTSMSMITRWIGTNGEVIRTVYYDGSYLYAASDYDGVIVFDPTNLVKLGSFSTNYPVISLTVKEAGKKKYCFAALGNYNNKGGLMVLDVTDPLNILLVQMYEGAGLNGDAVSVQMINNGAYVFTADLNKGFQSYFVQWGAPAIIPGKPVENSPPAASELKVKDMKAYIAGRESGVAGLDIVKGKVLFQIKNSLSMVNAVDFRDNLIFIADRMAGIVIYDISKIEKPELVASYDTSGDANALLVDGNMIYVADGIDGIFKLEWQPPKKFELRSYYNDGSIIYRFFYDKTAGRIYTACGKDGIRLLKE
jgi:hypothetical protein